MFIVRFVKADRTRFQQHVYDAINNFMRNFVVLLFAENAKESKNLLTNEVKQRLAKFHEKWVSYDYMASCFLFKSILNETWVLSNLLQTDDLMVYEVYDAIIKTKDNLDIIINEEGEDLPFEVIFIDKTVNKCHVEESAASKRGEKIATDRERALKERQYEEARDNINVRKTKTFTLNNVRQGQKKVRELKNDLLGEIVRCLDQRFEGKRR